MTNDQGANARRDIRAGFGAGQGIGASLILAMAILLTACSKREAENPAPAAAATASAAPTNSERRVFQVRGVVKEIKDTNTVSIAHEEIPGSNGEPYMVAMTMDFDVKNTNDLTGLAPNDQVTFSMIVTEDDGWIEHVRKIGASAPERPTTRVVRDVEELNIGDKMPDYSFTNSLGKKISLSDFNGQAYAYTFIFTRCPFPTFCPRMNMNLAAAYKQLTETPNAPTNWHLISISFDPDFDTPERLAQYSSLMYKPDSTKWSWVTGAMIDIDAIAEQVGLVFSFEKGTFNHNLRTVVVDKNGIIRQNFRGNEWKPEELVKEIVAGAEGKPVDKSL